MADENESTIADATGPIEPGSPVKSPAEVPFLSRWPRLRFWGHVLAGFLLVGVPAFGLHWWAGILVTVAVILTAEICAGMFDELLELFEAA